MPKRKVNIIKLSVSAVLLAAAFAVTKVIFKDLPFFAQLLIYLPSYLTVGFKVLSEAAEKLFKGKLLAEDFLMSVATVGALIMGDFAEATFVMLFFTLGEIFEESAEEKSEKAINDLLAVCADTATKIQDGAETTVDAKSVTVGETILIKPGERIPLDGIITEGETTVDTSFITGESMPRNANIGEKVFSGTLNLSAPITVKTTNSFETSTASKILGLIKDSAEKKAKTEKFITKFAKIYTPIVVALALLIAVVPSIISGDTAKHIYSALTFLVVSCPCALVVSVPISFFGAIGNASKKGMLVKGSDALENLSKIGVIAFDKTGTLTKGSFEVTAIHPETVDEEELIKIAASCEKHSTHPIAASLLSYVGGKTVYDAKNITEISGRGISCVCGGKEILIGNALLMSENGIEYHECHHMGTVIHMAVNGEYAGHIVISDSIKPEAKSTVEALGKMGIKTVMLTGDGKAAAESVAEETGIKEYFAELTPDKKVEKIEDYIENKKIRTAFLGDGINDAPVLVRADVGIAMGALGSDSAIDSADIVLMDDSISGLPKLIGISKKAVSIAKQNIIFSIAVKMAVLIISAVGFSNIMWLAAFADVGVLVLAVLNSTRTMKG